MQKTAKLSTQQLAQISYSRAEKVMNTGVGMLITSLAIGIFSFTILSIILNTLNPEGSRGFLPPNTQIELFIMFICVVVFAISLLVVFISSLIIIFRRTPQNTHRLQPIIVNVAIISLPMLITLLSIFIDYDSTRGFVMSIMGLVAFSSFIVTYPIYRHRLKVDRNSLTCSR